MEKNAGKDRLRSKANKSLAKVKNIFNQLIILHNSLFEPIKMNVLE